MLDPCTVKLADPDAPLFVCLTALAETSSADKATVTVPTR
jgi:hypothetical protein